MLLGLLVPSAATADDWTRADTAREITYQLIAAADWAQTRSIAKPNSGFDETNPFLGAKPSAAHVNKWFAAGAVAHAAVSYALPADWRRWWQWASISFEGGYVAHNARLGVKIDW